MILSLTVYNLFKYFVSLTFGFLHPVPTADTENIKKDHFLKTGGISVLVSLFVPFLRHKNTSISTISLFLFQAMLLALVQV